MKKMIIVAATFGFLGFIAGNAFWYLASPLWIDIQVNESISSSQTAATMGSGTFKGADALHKGSGKATIFTGTDGQKTLRFTDFNVTNGPDLKVWLVGAGDINSADDVNNSTHVSLGRLKGNIGAQNYSLPADLDVSKFKSVVIWCERFGVLFSSASFAQN